MGETPIIGWDVGGAHLKAARLDATGTVEQVIQIPCPLWQGLEHLHRAIAAARASLGHAPVHAVTMTGEMVDLFPDRGAGVRALVDALKGNVANASIHLYAGGRGFVAPATAAQEGRLVASANWHASARAVGCRKAAALLVDIGSTTTDLVPVIDGRVAARGADDASRLVTGELLYSGVVRTPLMALAGSVPFGGEWVPVMAEHFATVADVYRVVGALPEDADQHPAADGGPKTPEGSVRRLARMVGRDHGDAPPEAWRHLARWLARLHASRIADACDRILSRPDIPPDAPLVVAGVGRFLLTDLATSRRRALVHFGDLFPGRSGLRERIADCAPAVAVAVLARTDH